MASKIKECNIKVFLCSSPPIQVQKVVKIILPKSAKGNQHVELALSSPTPQFKSINSFLF